MSLTNKNLKPMTKQAMWDIGTETVIEYLKKNNYQIEGARSNRSTYPNIVAKKNGKLYGILIDANEVRKQPSYSVKGTFDMLRFARNFDAIPMYASIGIGSANHKRFDAQVLIDGDPEGYYVNFTGLEKIEYEPSVILTKEEKREYIIHLFGDCYETCDFKKIEKYIDNDCKWYSLFSGYEYKTKKDIMNYYYEKSKIMKKTKINYFLIKYVGSWFELKPAELELPDGKIEKGTTVKVPQPDGEIGLVIEQIKENNEKVGMAVTIGFNENGLINDIYIGDPYAMNFDDYYKYEEGE